MTTKIIPVPTWLFDDASLVALAKTIIAVAEARDFPSLDDRDRACLDAINEELKYRNGTFTLDEDGNIEAHPLLSTNLN